MINKCCICGKQYEGYGNSTWGYWKCYFGLTDEEDSMKGEELRCCDSCNRYHIVPARLKIHEKEINNEMD